MAAIEALALSFFSLHPSSSKFPATLKPSASANLHISNSRSSLALSFPISPPIFHFCAPSRKLCFELCSAVQELAVEDETEESDEPNLRKKLYVANLPWSLSVVDMKALFGQCGKVIDVEIIKQKDGRSRGFAFVTMDSGDEAQAVVDKFHDSEVSGRVIRVEFAKRFKRPPPPPPSPPPRETRHVIYVSNLAWKARSTHLREFFSATFSPVSARVVFDSPSGRSAGYGFVSFGTKEEAEAAISALEGKELMGRPLRLKFSERNVDESGEEKEKEDIPEEQTEEL